MIDKIKTCPICGDKFSIRDLRNPENHCGKLVCKTNYNYRKDKIRSFHRTGLGHVPSPEEMNKL